MWMHEHYMWSFWWLFPLLGVAFFVMLIVLLARAFGGSVSSGTRKEIEELRKEIRELKEEVEKVKKQGS